MFIRTPRWLLKLILRHVYIKSFLVFLNRFLRILLIVMQKSSKIKKQDVWHRETHSIMVESGSLLSGTDSVMDPHSDTDPDYLLTLIWIRIRILLITKVLRPLVYRPSTASILSLNSSWMRILNESEFFFGLQCGYGSGFSLWCGSGSSFPKWCGSGYAKLVWIFGSVPKHDGPGTLLLDGHLWFVCCREIAIRNHQLWTWRPCSRPQNSTCSRGGHSCAFTSFRFLRTPLQKGFLAEWWAWVRGV